MRLHRTVCEKTGMGHELHKQAQPNHKEERAWPVQSTNTQTSIRNKQHMRKKEQKHAREAVKQGIQKRRQSKADASEKKYD